jgi:hypothetical protein
VAIHHNDKVRVKMVGKVRRQTAIVVAIASLGLAALTGCTSGTPKPEPTVLTTKSAGAYYLGTTCKADATGEMFTAAVNIAEQSSAATGPDLDNSKSAAVAYESASRVAATSFDNPKAAWPTSVRKSVLVMRDQYLAELPALKAMAKANPMSDEATSYSHFPDTTKALAASKHIRSKLGLPSNDASDSCPPPPGLSAALATGLLIAGTGYTFHAPAGWTLPKRVPQANAYAIAARPDAEGFYDTINVLGADSNTDSFDEEEQNGVAYFEQAVGATAIQVRPRIEIAGEESVHISSLQTHEGATRWTEQYLVTHIDAAWTITFDFNEA